jgi:hypothetical protein
LKGARLVMGPVVFEGPTPLIQELARILRLNGAVQFKQLPDLMGLYAEVQVKGSVRLLNSRLDSCFGSAKPKAISEKLVTGSWAEATVWPGGLVFGFSGRHWSPVTPEEIDAYLKWQQARERSIAWKGPSTRAQRRLPTTRELFNGVVDSFPTLVNPVTAAVGLGPLQSGCGPRGALPGRTDASKTWKALDRLQPTAELWSVYWALVRLGRTTTQIGSPRSPK